MPRVQSLLEVLIFIATHSVDILEISTKSKIQKKAIVQMKKWGKVNHQTLTPRIERWLLNSRGIASSQIYGSRASAVRTELISSLGSIGQNWHQLALETEANEISFLNTF